ncbi:MAG: discoidin domain-containing protein [Lentisphaerota bacterium]
MIVQRCFMMSTALLMVLAGCATSTREGAKPCPVPRKPVCSQQGEPPPKTNWVLTASALQEDIFPAAYAADDRMDTRWSSPASDPQWLQMDMGRTSSICGMTLHWESAYSSEYKVQISLDGTEWQDIYTCANGDGRTDEIFFSPADARFVRILCLKRATGWGHSIYEVELKGLSEQVHVKALSKPGAGGEKMFDGCPVTAWVNDGAPTASVEMDFRRIKTFGGMRIDWGDNAAGEVQMSVSRDGKDWRQVAGLREGTGGYDLLMHTPATGRYVRLDVSNPLQPGPMSIREITLRGPEESLTQLSRYQIAASKAPAGCYPDSLRGRQVYWTLVGLPDDRQESLFDEYGNLEPVAGAPSLMPYVYVKGQLFSAMDASPLTQTLEQGYFPLPAVQWSLRDLQVDISAMTMGEVGSSLTAVRYQLENRTAKPLQGSLFLAVRPVQINPPWQYGGLSSIRSLEFKNLSGACQVLVNGQERYLLLSPPARAGVVKFGVGDIVRDLSKGTIPSPASLVDDEGLLSGAAEYSFHLQPGEKAAWVVAAPLFARSAAMDARLKALEEEPLAEFDHAHEKAAEFWNGRLGSAMIDLPATDVVRSVRAQIAYMLINRDGLAIQPGSRNYKRSWMRDGSLTISAMLRMGVVEPVRDYLDWYAERVQPDGLVPPILNNDGTINTGFGSNLEYDSQGEFVYAIMEYYRFTRDRDFLGRHFPEIERAMRYMAALRDKTLAPDYMAGEPARGRFAGILPKSISHEGYDPPMHSYWDDFWALKGWKDGRDAAEILGETNTALWAEEQYSLLRSSVLASIRETMEFKQINYIPGCAEKGDMDATSTAIAFFPCDEWRSLPEAALQTTFDRYYADLILRLRPGWVGGFTPYENRSITAFVDLNRKDYAQVLLDYLMTCRRPAAWQEWGEVVLSEERKGGYIGDMPHTWVGAGWVNAVRGMLAEERDGQLILLAGAPLSWLVKGEGVLLEKLPTHYGPLNLRAQVNGNVLKLYMDSNLDAPGGLVVRWPLRGRPVWVRVDGGKWKDYDDKECRLPVSVKEMIAVWK